MNLGVRKKTVPRTYLTISPCSPIQRMVAMEKRQGFKLKWIVQEALAEKYGPKYPKILAAYLSLKSEGAA